MLEQDQRKMNGFGDHLMEMQQRSWLINKIWKGSFKIDMRFTYGDEDGEISQWCQETVIRIPREERTYVTVQINWDKDTFDNQW
jgi:hypothetical protein